MRAKCGVFEPVGEARLAEPRIIVRNERALAKLHAVVACVPVGDNLASIVLCSQTLLDELIETEFFWPPYFNGGIHRRTHRNLFDCAGDIVSRHRLDQRKWQAHFVAVGGKIGDAFEEFEELSRADN